MDRKVDLRVLTPSDEDDALLIINTAARWYAEFLPAEDLHHPEMRASDWAVESSRMQWFGAFLEGRLIAVAALEGIEDVVLFRHAYVLPEHQRGGVGEALAQFMERMTAPATRIIVGTYAANYKARGALEKLGFELCADSAVVLAQYYTIPAARLRDSVAYEKHCR